MPVLSKILMNVCKDAECKGLKSSLVKMEDQGSGRVRLSEFYKPAADGHWQFQEALDYLRDVGALEEIKSTPVLL